MSDELTRTCRACKRELVLFLFTPSELKHKSPACRKCATLAVTKSNIGRTMNYAPSRERFETGKIFRIRKGKRVAALKACEGGQNG